MHLEILVEEQSAEAALQKLLPKIVGQEVSFRIITHQGKKDLIKNIPKKLRAYSKWITNEIKIVVLVDLDRDDCGELKLKLNNAAEDAGLKIKTSIGELSSDFQVLNRIAIEELESWFLGDKKAIHKSYNKVSEKELNKSKYSGKYKDKIACIRFTTLLRSASNDLLERVSSRTLAFIPRGRFTLRLLPIRTTWAITFGSL